jgi:regulatory protein
MRNPPEKSLRSRALEALSRREHSRTELARKLAPHTDNPDELHALLDDLQARGWLSDARYTEQIIHARQARYGSRKIAYELREQGIDDSLISASLAALKDTELARARGVWEKKFGQPPTTEQEKAKQIRFMQSRGFGWGVIVRVIAGKTKD